MELTPEQTDALPFPKGCPVWYNFPDKSSSDMEVDEVSSILLKQVSLFCGMTYYLYLKLQ